MRLRTLLSFIVSLCFVQALSAALRMPALFGDHMVLQCDKAVPVWGWAQPGESVTVRFSGLEKRATADASGAWRVVLEPMKASGEARELKVSVGTGAEPVTYADVLVGEVWLGSGQSNMAYPAASAEGFEALKASAELPLIRFFKEESPGADTAQTLGKGRWVLCSPNTVGGFSAVLAFFGRELHGRLKGVPVGLINSSVGGTPIEGWLAPELQRSTPGLLKGYEDEEKAYQKFDYKAEREKYRVQYKEWEEASAKAKAAGQKPPIAPNDMATRMEVRRGPGGLFNGKIAPLAPYALRGVIWYQGEANGSTVRGQRYQQQLEALVTDWRRRWGAPEMPFLWIQLPNWKKASSWTAIRESQLKCLRLPKTGMVVTIDIGNPDDVHPSNKIDVAKRAAAWVLGEVHGQGGATSGPLPAGFKIQGDAVVLAFSHTHRGLVSRDAELKGFLIAGADRVWREATARIEGGTVSVSAPGLTDPVAVRYAWGGSPACSLANGAGLPSSPFRTDDWPLDAQGK